eukprot:1987663-Prymnesium_polylepis.2
MSAPIVCFGLYVPHLGCVCVPVVRLVEFVGVYFESIAIGNAGASACRRSFPDSACDCVVLCTCDTVGVARVRLRLFTCWCCAMTTITVRMGSIELQHGSGATYSRR